MQHTKCSIRIKTHLHLHEIGDGIYKSQTDPYLGFAPCCTLRILDLTLILIQSGLYLQSYCILILCNFHSDFSIETSPLSAPCIYPHPFLFFPTISSIHCVVVIAHRYPLNAKNLIFLEFKYTLCPRQI